MTNPFNNPGPFVDKNSQSELEGQIERVTYFNEETGYTVAKLTVPGYREPVAVVGNLVGPTPGETLIMKGIWHNHPKFGRQFKVVSHLTKVPATVSGIKKYLGSRLIKGIGPVMATRIVQKFGEETLEIIEHHIEKLTEVEGIGQKRIDMIKEAWIEQKEIREVMIFLQAHDVSTAHATKIFRKYGWNSISVVTRNPYRLATDIFGIGFLTADKIARKIGFEKNSPLRAEAGILYVLNQLSEEGHVYYPYELLMEKCKEILEVDRDIIIKAFGTIALEERIVIEDLNQDLMTYQANRKSVYAKQFYVSETGTANHLKRLIFAKKNIRKIDREKAINWVQKTINLTFATKQIEAVKCAISEKIMVITGGPGTGKTTIINAVLQIYRQLNAKILLAAPTGRASKRMTESTGYPAKTIHRLLEFSPQKWQFQRNQDNPLKVDVLILDECSMIDNNLMHHLVKGVPAGATVILVGDVNQLPSVGPGSVLKDIIKSDVVPVVELNEIIRQAGASHIVFNAHKINSGLMPSLKTTKERLDDFYFIEQDDPEQVLNIIMELVCERIPRRFNFDPIDDIQVLSPMHKGTAGTDSLNARLQSALNPSKKELSRGGRTFRLKDKVMQVRNNYEKDVYNGDIGRITDIDPDRQEVTVTFDGIPVPYEYADLDEIILAYAISVHKSQGSEYRAVIIPILSQHYVLLQRNLIYTAVTRGKDLVVMVGSRKALAIGVKNNKILMRYTYLAERLAESAKNRQPPNPGKPELTIEY
jgi:exodeoxyribonuclease V alpha subunit